MKAGRKLDVLVAENVMDEKVEYLNFNQMGSEKVVSIPVFKNGGVTLPRYSTNIAAAWEVVEKLNDVWDLELEIYKGMETRAIFRKIGQQEVCYLSFGATAPYAICLVALKVPGAGGDSA